MPPLAWHADSASNAARRLGVDHACGLDEAEAAERLRRHGPNQLSERPGKPAWQRFAAQLAQPLVLVLIAAGAITAGLGEGVDAGVIFGVVLVNALIGYWQEAKAEGALAALARSVATPVTVRRSGHRRQLDASQLVPGDIVLLATVDRGITAGQQAGRCPGGRYAARRPQQHGLGRYDGGCRAG